MLENFYSSVTASPIAADISGSIFGPNRKEKSLALLLPAVLQFLWWIRLLYWFLIEKIIENTFQVFSIPCQLKYCSVCV